jgi:outer membrane protein TolC
MKNTIPIIPSRRFVFKTGVLLYWLFGTNLQAQELLTIEDVIQITLQNNYGLQIARDNLQIAENNFHPGRAGFLPTLDLSASLSHSKINSEQQYADPNRPAQIRKNAGSDNENAGAVLNWTIFDGFKMFAAYARYNSLEKMERFKLRKEMETKISEAILAYNDMVQKKLIMEVDREAVAISEQRLKIVQQGYELGVSSNLDVLQARVDLNSDRSVFLSQEVEVSDARSQLIKVMARPEQDMFMVIDTIRIVPDLELGDLRQNLFNRNSDYLIGQQDLAVARSELGEIRAEFFPSINLSSSYSYNRSESQAGFFEMNKTYGYSYGAQVSWNLFNGFNTYREIQNARLNRRSKQIYMEELKTNLLSDFSALALKYRNSLTRMQLEQENVGVASENVKIALEIYQLGTITPLQLREVQKNYVAAKSRLISTAYEVKQNEVGLLQLSGELVKGELE